MKNYHHWFNPCAFANPWNAAATAIIRWPQATTSPIRRPILSYVGGRRGQIAGPGYNRVNMSIFKSFKLFHEQTLDFRTDVFNLLNTSCAWRNPNDTNIDSNAGQITGTRNLQRYSPDSRFFQTFTPILVLVLERQYLAIATIAGGSSLQRIPRLFLVSI